jgi:hypothetical protein
VKKGGIKKILLLSLAMFIAGYLAAVCTLRPENLDNQDQESDYRSKLDGITVQIRDMVKEHGAKAYGEIAEYIKSLHKDDEAKEQE